MLLCKLSCTKLEFYFPVDIFNNEANESKDCVSTNTRTTWQQALNHVLKNRAPASVGRTMSDHLQLLSACQFLCNNHSRYTSIFSAKY